jgi:hypothetical protein
MLQLGGGSEIIFLPAVVRLIQAPAAVKDTQDGDDTVLDAKNDTGLSPVSDNATPAPNSSCSAPREGKRSNDAQ